MDLAINEIILYSLEHQLYNAIKCKFLIDLALVLACVNFIVQKKSLLIINTYSLMLIYS